MIDLHTHSSISDGVLSPVELVRHAHNHHIKVLALTDHDCVDGIKDACAECEKLGITFVAGVELNISWPTGEFHLLGLGLKSISTSLQEILLELQNGRNERNLKIIKKMHDAGFDVSLEEIQSKYKTSCLGRPHFASYMFEKKFVKTKQQAFDKYLGKNCSMFVERFGADLDKSIQAIKSSGGIPVMAHPLSIYVSFGKIKSVLENLKQRGIVGIEAYHPGARFGECTRLESIGRELGFLITAGSDYHGEMVRADRRIGHTAGGLKIDDKFYEDIREYL